MNAPAKPETVAFAESELSGKLLALVVMQLERQKNPWSMTSQANQDVFLNKAREAIEKVVRDAVMTIATNRIPAVVVTLDTVKFDGDGVEGKITMAKVPASYALADAAGQHAYILLANPEAFTGGAEKVKSEKDQRELLESQPEIVKKKGRYIVQKDNVPMVGGDGPDGKGFKTHAAAEKWLQEQLKVGRAAEKKEKKSKKGAAPAPDKPADWPFPPTQGTAPAAPPAPGPELTLDAALVAFRAAGIVEQKKDGGDFDNGLAAIRATYPPDFIEEHAAELETAYADGWEKGGE